MAARLPWQYWTVGLSLVGWWSAGCVLIPDPNHCANNQKSCGAGRVCDSCTPASQSVDADGCVASGSELDLDLLQGGCQLGVGGMSTDSSIDSETQSTISTSEATETLDVDTTQTLSGSAETSPVPCVSDEECTEGTARFCSDPLGVCVDCSEVEPDACATADAANPVCDGGACVPCSSADPGVCGGETPMCDSNNTCWGCTQHADCGSNVACNLFTHECLTTVVRVGPAAVDDYTTLNAAVASFGGGERGTIVVAAAELTETVTVNNDRVLGILVDAQADPALVPVWTRGGAGANESPLTVTGATVLIEGFQITGNSGTSLAPAVMVETAASIWLDRMQVTGNNESIRADGSTALVLRNSFVNSAASDTVAISLNSPAMARIEYSTIIADFGGESRGIYCSSGAGVEVHNSIVLSLHVSDTIVFSFECQDAFVTHTATEVMVEGLGNFTVADPIAPFFVDETNADYHLSAMAGCTAFQEKGLWTDGSPLVDIDGDARPLVNRALDFVGADSVPAGCPSIFRHGPFDDRHQ